MSRADYASLQDVIMDADFPDLDLALRRGRHVDRDDAAWYTLLSDAQELLEPFYRRYGCELIHKTDGYFYLLPTSDKLSRKQLSASDMLVGQALALLYLDPAAIDRGGVVTHEELIAQLSAVLGSDALIAAFHPGKRKRFDERIAQRNVRSRVAEAVRRLSHMGFVEPAEDDRVRLRSALMRFAEPVRGLSEPAEALAKLVAQGEVALEPEQDQAPIEAQDADVDVDPDLADGQDGASEPSAEHEAPAPQAHDEVPDAELTPAQPPAREAPACLAAAPSEGRAFRGVEQALQSVTQEHDAIEAGSSFEGLATGDAAGPAEAVLERAGTLVDHAADGGDERAAEAARPQQAAEPRTEPKPAAHGAQARELDWADILLPEAGEPEDAG